LIENRYKLGNSQVILTSLICALFGKVWSRQHVGTVILTWLATKTNIVFQKQTIWFCLSLWKV